MTDSTFKTGIAFLSKIYGKTLDDDVYQAYWSLLKHITDEAFKGILENIVSSFVSTAAVQFPLPAHFLAVAGLGGENRAILAVQTVKSASCGIGGYSSVSFGDPALHETINGFGGWPVVAAWGEEVWKFQEKAFIAHYRANLAIGRGPAKLAGLHEIQNAGGSFSQEHAKKLAQQKIPAMIEWIGFDESKCLTSHEHIQPAIRGHGGPTKIGALISRDGKVY